MLACFTGGQAIFINGALNSSAPALQPYSVDLPFILGTVANQSLSNCIIDEVRCCYLCYLLHMLHVRVPTTTRTKDILQIGKNEKRKKNRCWHISTRTEPGPA